MLEPYQIVRITAYLNLIFFALIMATCRCTIFWKIARKVLGDKIFNLINKYHCTYWYGFTVSVLVHAILATNPGLLY
ncbi:hypothetical protein ACFLRF_05300 [Candidatus Altiarchaeota archaeon]